MDINELQNAAKALFKAQQQIARAEQKLKPLKEAEKVLENELLQALLKAKLEQVAIKEATFALRRSEIAVITDDKKFFDYVAKKKAWDLVRKQANVGACRVRWDDNINIPGVVAEKRVALSVTKRK
jgi:hypothetical protein